MTTNNTSLAKLASDALSTRSTPDALIGLVQKSAMDKLGGLPVFKSQGEEKIFWANVNHGAALILSGLTDKTYQAQRLHIWNMYQSGDFQFVRMPLSDALTGEPIINDDGLPECQSFQSFDDWFEYVCETSRADSTISSVTYNAVTKLLPAVATGKIDAEWTEYQGDQMRTAVRPVTVDDVCRIERSKLEIIMSPVRKILKDYSNDGDETHLRDIGQIVERSLTLSKKELKQYLAGAGHSGSEVMLISAYTAELPSNNAAMLLILNEAQRKYVEALIGARLAESSATTEQVLSVLSDLIYETTEVEEESPDPRDHIQLKKVAEFSLRKAASVPVSDDNQTVEDELDPGDLLGGLV